MILGWTFNSIPSHETQEIFFSGSWQKGPILSAPLLQPHPELLRERRIGTEGAKANSDENRPHSFWRN